MHAIRKTALAAIPAAAIAFAGLTVTGPARAATPDLGDSTAHCLSMNGKTSSLRQSPQGPAPARGTVFTFPANTTCHDINITFVSATDRYQGWLQASRTGRWSHCNAIVTIRKGHHRDSPPVLCRGVRAHTKFAVVALSGHQRMITVKD